MHSKEIFLAHLKFIVLSCLFDPVDCQWGEWKSSECNQTCGSSAFKRMTREILTPAAFGGKECTGQSVKDKNCNLSPCPSKSTLIINQNLSKDNKSQYVFL